MAETGVEISNDGLVVRCPSWLERPGLIHGVTTRNALPERGKEDFFTVIQRARQAGAIPHMMTLGAQQVHEAHLECICEPIELRKHPDGFRSEVALQAGEFPSTDALITAIAGVLIVVQTADCLPVFLLDQQQQLAGVAHCGWRGLRQGLAGKTVREMVKQGAVPDQLEAWLGPCIQVERYEVGEALVNEFRAAFPGAVASPDGTHLDLPAIASWQLEQAGLNPQRIFNSGECTRSQLDRYHSFRGEAEHAGRILSFIGFQA